jgi:hypothetical protein
MLHVGGIRVELPAVARWDAGVATGLGAGGDIDRAVLAGFLDRLLRPFAGVDVVGRSLAAQHVHRHDGVLADGAALHEQHLVVRRHGQQLAQQAFGLGMDGDELLAAVAHFHHRHA